MVKDASPSCPSRRPKLRILLFVILDLFVECTGWGLLLRVLDRLDSTKKTKCDRLFSYATEAYGWAMCVVCSLHTLGFEALCTSCLLYNVWHVLFGHCTCTFTNQLWQTAN